MGKMYARRLSEGGLNTYVHSVTYASALSVHGPRPFPLSVLYSEAVVLGVELEDKDKD